MNDLTRRRFLQTTAAAGLGTALAPPVQAATPPLDAARFPALDAQDHMPWLGLATSLLEEHRYKAEVVGAIPPALRGTLYRNGPGRFERAGLRKRCLLDGDGMLQRFEFTDDGVLYQNRFTRTQKLLTEEESGEYRYASWTTQAPGGMLANLFARNLRNQAGVSVHRKNGVIYAFDESNAPYEIDPESFETLGISALGKPQGAGIYAAHPKSCARTGQWIHFGLGYGREITAHFTAFESDGRVAWTRALALPRYVYVHDWFVSERHLVVVLHPAEVAIFGFLLGRRSLAESIRWKPERGNLLWVIPRGPSGDPVEIEAESAWMWHALNAYEKGGEIVADFVGYDAPNDFLGEDPAFWAVMEGRRGNSSPGSLRRYVIDPAARSVREERLAENGHYEFPFVNPHRACVPHVHGYFARGSGETPFWEEIVRVDMHSGARDSFAFGERNWCGEPVFVPHPDAGERERGWLLTQVYDGKTRRSRLAILDAEHVPDGPVAEVQLRHHVPLSFHGSWTPA